MKKEFLQIVQDTISFYRAEYELPLLAPPLKVAPPSIPKKEPVKVVTPAPPPEIKQVSKEAERNIKEPIFSLIEKHLPHIHLLKEPPFMAKSPQVAILVESKEDLPFLKNLAQAIQSRSCHVKLVSMEKLTQDNSWETFFKANDFSLILSQSNQLPPFILLKKPIILAPIATYQNNTESKKELWSFLCQKIALLKSL